VLQPPSARASARPPRGRGSTGVVLSTQDQDEGQGQAQGEAQGQAQGEAQGEAWGRAKVWPIPLPRIWVDFAPSPARHPWLATPTADNMHCCPGRLLQFGSCIVHAFSVLLLDTTPFLYNAVQAPALPSPTPSSPQKYHAAKVGSETCPRPPTHHPSTHAPTHLPPTHHHPRTPPPPPPTCSVWSSRSGRALLRAVRGQPVDAAPRTSQVCYHVQMLYLFVPLLLGTKPKAPDAGRRRGGENGAVDHANGHANGNAQGNAHGDANGHAIKTE